MKVNQVLDIFRNPSTQQDEEKDIWMIVQDRNGRVGYLCLDFDKHPLFKEISDFHSLSDKEFARATELLLMDSTLADDFSIRPCIDDSSPALQNLFDNLENSCAITFFDLEENKEWENLGISREEYEHQIDSDIQKYGLDDVVCKYNDEDCLYTCYGDFLCRFSKSSGMELSDTSQNKESSKTASVVKEESNPLASISFVPVDFQRENDSPFRICEILDRSNQDNPCVTYAVIRGGKDEALFTASEGKGQQRDHAFFSALDYIACAYHDSPELALKNFNGSAYAKKYYEISLYSNPETRLQYNPMALDAYWKEKSPDYSTDSVFGNSLLNGELTANFISEIETGFNSSLENPNFRFSSELIQHLDAQPTIREIRVLDDSSNIIDTPLFAAAQYEWEQERTRQIFDTAGKEILTFLSSLDAAIAKHGPTRASLECFTDMLNELCVGREDKLKDMDIPFSSQIKSSKDMDVVYMNCHKALNAVEQSIGHDNSVVMR